MSVHDQVVVDGILAGTRPFSHANEDDREAAIRQLSATGVEPSTIAARFRCNVDSVDRLLALDAAKAARRQHLASLSTPSQRDPGGCVTRRTYLAGAA